MSILNENIDQEINRIKKKIENENLISLEDFKVILLSILCEEDLHELNQ